MDGHEKRSDAGEVVGVIRRLERKGVGLTPQNVGVYVKMSGPQST